MDAPGGQRLSAPDGFVRGPSESGPPDGSENGGHGILLVEDNPGDVALFREAIDESDVPGELHVATTGDEALSVLDDATASTSTSIDIVVLDLDLPDRPGFAVLEELKGDPVTRSIPVVVLSSSDDRREVRRAYHLGANAYLVKRMHYQETVTLVAALATFWFETAELPR